MVNNMVMISRANSKTQERSRWPALATTMSSSNMNRAQQNVMTLSQKIDRWYVLLRCLLRRGEGGGGRRVFEGYEWRGGRDRKGEGATVVVRWGRLEVVGYGWLLRDSWLD